MAKLGLTTDTERTHEFVTTTLNTLAQNDVDFTLFYDTLTNVAQGDDEGELTALFSDRSRAEDWLSSWREHRPEGASDSVGMHQANPALVARNHRVEQALDAAVERGDLAPFRRLCRALAEPHSLAAEDREPRDPPMAHERVRQTFCGT